MTNRDKICLFYQLCQSMTSLSTCHLELDPFNTEFQGLSVGVQGDLRPMDLGPLQVVYSKSNGPYHWVFWRLSYVPGLSRTPKRSG